MLRYGIVLTVALLVAACADGVQEASCSACQGQRYSAEQCQMWAEEAGCESSTVFDNAGGSCPNGCRFENCDRAPECVPMPPPRADAAAPAPDAAASNTSDPDCALADDRGLFSRCPAACGKCGTLMYNGLTRYTCNCDMPCPCGYRCGSIDLPIGGTISGVCAPPD